MHRLAMRVLLALLVCCLWWRPAYSGDLRPLTPEDLWKECGISDPVVAPDGRHAAYVLTTIDRAKNAYCSNIYEVGLAGGEPPVQLTRGDCRDTEPRYSPDGEWIAFVSDRGGKALVYLLRRRGGEPYVAFSLDSDMSSIAWAPDSKRICFLAKVPRPEPATDVKVITRFRYRIDDVGYLDEHEEQIYEGDVRTGQVRRLTDDLFSIAGPVYSPDGKTILFTANVTTDHDFNYNSDICTVSLTGTADPYAFRRITETPEGEARARYSPDGRRVAFLRARRPNDYYATDDLWVMDLPVAAGMASSIRNLTGAFDRNVTYEGYDDGWECAPRWSRDGKSVYVVLQIGPDAVLYRCDAVRGGRPERVLGIEGQIEYPHLVNADKRLLHGRQTATESTELYVSTIDGSSAQRLTFHQRDRLKDRCVVAPERLRIRSKDGTPVDGWLLKPPGFDPSKKYPLILAIHGGPIWFYGNAFSFERQVWAGAGYVILYANPRGSSGYGQAFVDCIKANWGELDYQDLMAAVDAALATGYVDEKRMAVTGLSYGGIMTNWIVGHTNRFKAAVSEEGLSNYYSSYGTDDCQVDWENELGLPWENEALYRRLSPITYAKNVTTPLLIIHGEDDYRTGVDQAEQWFVTLKRLGKDVTFLCYPRESHEWRYGGEPLHRLDRMNRILDWWRKYLR
ncbi:MAG: S9 family peptidase [Acidobacteriota bacterium]